MAAADPTYPLYPIACLLASAMLLLVLLTSFIRQSWNLGVAFLCFWLFFENLVGGANTIIWSDNADLKLYIYCDIVSHISLITYIVKPMATLIITRRLYLITRLQTVDFADRAAKRKDLAIEWTLGILIPILVGGPLYYVVQRLRFEVQEGFGCSSSVDGSILSILLLRSWSVLPPFFSIVVYYPHVTRTFYRHSRDIHHFLQSNGSVSRTDYFRVLALASIDIILTLPIGITIISLAAKALYFQRGSIPFYFGWANDHDTNWGPEGFSYASEVAAGPSSVAEAYFVLWSSPVLAFVIFGLFGVTFDARASYWRIICITGGWFGWKPKPRASRARSSLADIEFGERRAHGSISLGIDSHPSFINPDARARNQPTEGGQGTTSDTGVDSEKDVSDAERQGTSDATHAECTTRRSGSFQAEIGASGAV